MSKQRFQGKIEQVFSFLPVFVNKTLLNHCNAHLFTFCNLCWYFYFEKNGFCSLKPDSKKAKNEGKGDSEEGAQTPEETEDSVEKPDDKQEDSEGPSLPLGLTGNFQDLNNVIPLRIRI